MATRIDLGTQGAQAIRVDLDGVVYRLQIRWNSVAEAWIMDVLSDAGTLLRGGIPLVENIDVMLVRNAPWPGRLAVEAPQGILHAGNPGRNAWQNGWMLIYHEFSG